MRQAVRSLARFAAGSGGLLSALAVALLLVPEHLPGLRQLDGLLLPATVELLPEPPSRDSVAVVRLPTPPAASPEQQQAAMAWLANALPASRQTVVWVDNAGLQGARLWTPEGQALQQALATLAPTPPPLARDSAPATWRRQLVSLSDALRLEASGANDWPRAMLLQSTEAGLEPTPLLDGYLRSQQFTPRWTAEGLRLPNGNLLSGPDGIIYPHTALRGWHPQEVAIEALPAENKPAVLVVGATEDARLDNTAAALQSLLDGAYSYSPWWSAPLDKLLVALLLLHYLLLLPRLGTGSGFLLTLLGGVLMLAAQFGLQLTRSEWISFTGGYGMLLVGYPLAALGAFAARDRRQLHATANRASLELARYQIRQGEFDPARKQLLNAAPSQDRLELLYDLAIAYERRRQYSNACEAFAACMRQDKSFRDVKDRLALLQQVGRISTGGTLSSVSTLVMPQSVEKPVLGRYQLERELGRGAMGVVYLGVDPKISRNVAIKTLDMAQLPQDEVEEFKERFFREAEAAGRLSHPSIVTVYDVGEEGDLAFIAMDYASGRPLSDYTDASQLLPIEKVYALMAEVAEALDYAHSKGIVHRDIKPANLIYDPEQDSIKITDFGIARIGDTRRTSTGTVLGSPSYMAPEQFAGGTAQGTSDIFSLGVTFYQLLTGKLPFSGENIAQLAYQISQARHTNARKLRQELPASSDRILAKALAKLPEDRYQRAGEMAEALRRGIPKRKAS